jgi:hypothetical protein
MKECDEMKNLNTLQLMRGRERLAGTSAAELSLALPLYLYRQSRCSGHEMA